MTDPYTGLSTHTANVLRNAEFWGREPLKLSYKELSKLPGVGKKALEEIEKIYGIKPSRVLVRKRTFSQNGYWRRRDQYSIWVVSRDGKRIDSFLRKEYAERLAARLRLNPHPDECNPA